MVASPQVLMTECEEQRAADFRRALEKTRLREELKRYRLGLGDFWRIIANSPVAAEMVAAIVANGRALEQADQPKQA